MKNNDQKIKNEIKPPSITDIAKKSNMSTKEVNSFLCLVKRSMKPFSKRISVIENGTKRYYTVERRGVGFLKLNVQVLVLYLAIDDQWKNIL